MNEEILEKAIQELEAGKTITQVLSMFGNNSELEEELKFYSGLKSSVQFLKPDFAFKNKLFEKIKAKEKNEFNLVSFLQANLKLILPLFVGAAVLIVIFVQRSHLTQIKNQQTAFQKGSDLQATVDGIIADYTSDSQIILQDDTDANDIQKTYSTYNLNDIKYESTY